MSRRAQQTVLCSMKLGGRPVALLQAMADSTASVMDTITFIDGAVGFAIIGYLAEVW